LKKKRDKATTENFHSLNVGGGRVFWGGGGARWTSTINNTSSRKEVMQVKGVKEKSPRAEKREIRMGVSIRVSLQSLEKIKKRKTAKSR